MDNQKVVQSFVAVVRNAVDVVVRIVVADILVATTLSNRLVVVRAVA